MSRAVVGALALAACCLGGARASQAQTQRVARITHYDQGSVTYSGEPVGPGVAACSFNIPLYAHVTVNGWYTVQCLDRGALGFSDWVDIFTPDAGGWVESSFGDWAVIEVQP